MTPPSTARDAAWTAAAATAAGYLLVLAGVAVALFAVPYLLFPG
ncbi:MAG: hypothetical protein ABEJ70_00280 [Halobacteriaceae archaeon]